MTSTVVLIPAFNAAASVRAVIQGMRHALPGARVLVIDDGSSDGTGAVAADTADEVISLKVNQGKGAALRAGFARALELGAGVVLTADADGQHDPTYAPALIAALEQADVVIGARQRTGTAMPLRRRLANSLSSAAISAFTGCRITDAQSGYRAIRADVLRRVQPTGDRYEFESAFLLLAGRAGFRVAEVSIPTIYGPASHFRAWADTMRVIATIWRHRSFRSSVAGSLGVRG